MATWPEIFGTFGTFATFEAFGTFAKFKTLAVATLHKWARPEASYDAGVL
jgi:hypothetical protein